MMKHQIRTESDAFLYLVDCQLATVANLAMKKSRGKGDYERHKAIAQTGVDFAKGFNLNIRPGSRIYQVLNTPNRSVSEWAAEYEE